MSWPSLRRELAPPAIEGVDHVHVSVGDRAAAVRWYADVLGFRPVGDLAFWARDGGPLTIGNESGTVHLALFERVGPASTATIAFKASAGQFLRWREHLGQLLGGNAPALVDHEVAWSLYFSDPDGNPFEITSHEHAELRHWLSAA